MSFRPWSWFAAIGLVFLSCRTPAPQDTSNLEGLGIPTEDGIPISFISDLPAQVGHEIFKNLGLIMNAANPDGKFKNIRPMDIAIGCEAASPTENHCRMIYDGPEMKLNLADILFRTMSGQVFVRRGCKGKGCDKPPMKMWWRTVKGKTQSGEQTLEFEVCDIRGVEAGVSVNTPFAVGNDLLDKINYKPDIKGFKATIAETSMSVPITDDQGRPLTNPDGSMRLQQSTAFKTLGLQAGFGPLGPFPTPNCLLKDDREDDFFRRQKGNKDNKNLPIPDEALAKVPAHYIQLTADMTQHLAKESRGQALHINLRCQDIPHKPVCEMRYKGPTVTLPIPRYITGIFDGEVQALRRCQNPGCVQRTEAVLRMTTYQMDQLETIEICSASGMEFTTYKKIPFQSRIMGAPDIAGMLMRIDAGSPAKGINTKDPRVVTPATLKSFHVGIAGIGRYPTTRCLFVED